MRSLRISSEERISYAQKQYDDCLGGMIKPYWSPLSSVTGVIIAITSCICNLSCSRQACSFTMPKLLSRVLGHATGHAVRHTCYTYSLDINQ